MFSESQLNREELLTALFGHLVEPSYDEETETNMRVRLDVRQLDRIVSVSFEDQLSVAN